jgi:hypothetical protein
MLSAHREGKWAFASDYARLDIVYENGGVYLDNDVELIKGIDDLLCDEAFAGISVLECVATGLGFGAVKGFPLLKEMMDRYDAIAFKNEDGTLNLATNGIHQTEVLVKHGFARANRIQSIMGMRIYPSDVLSPMDNYGNPGAFTANTRAIHHYDASWFGDSEAAKRNGDLQTYETFWSKHGLDCANGVSCSANASTETEYAV